MDAADPSPIHLSSPQDVQVSGKPSAPLLVRRSVSQRSLEEGDEEDEAWTEPTEDEEEEQQQKEQQLPSVKEERSPCQEVGDDSSTEEGPPGDDSSTEEGPPIKTYPFYDTGEESNFEVPTLEKARPKKQAKQRTKPVASQVEGLVPESALHRFGRKFFTIACRGLAHLTDRPRSKPPRVEGVVQKLHAGEETLRQAKFVQAGASPDAAATSSWWSHQEYILERGRLMTEKLTSGKSRAWRHKCTFAMVQADFVMSAFWMGRWPETFYMYYTIQYSIMLFCKTCDFVSDNQHYFLLDFCYAANAYVLMWFWFFPTSGVAFNMAEGACGLLAISIVLFRNSCVPHDFSRISNAYVHYPAILAMLSTKLQCSDALLLGMQTGSARLWYVRVWDAWIGWMAWAVFYASVHFLFARKRIARKERDTLYKYIIGEYSEGLPKWMKPYKPFVYMFGHQVLFLSGLPWLFLPDQLQAGLLGLVLFIFAHNGGRFYVDHFWKTYERNCAQYLDAACKAIAEPQGE